MKDDSVSARLRPVHVLTGFLGSGKTTLLRHWLADPACSDTAVIVNEFGEIGLDHLLLREVARDIVLLRSGCLCCTVRDDLVSTLEELAALAATGAIPAFARVVVETTGLADPAPVMQVLMGEPRLADRFRLGRTIATIDGVNGLGTLANHAEAVQQAMFADALIVTKGDLAPPSGPLDARLDRLNPTASRFLSAPGSMPPTETLLGDPDAAVNDRYPPPKAPDPAPRHRHAAGEMHGIDTFTIAFDKPVDRGDFIEWLTLLLFNRGGQILRVKGILRFADTERPVVVQGVQHIVYPLDPLGAAEFDGPSELVFITRGIGKSAVERSLRDIR